MKARILFLSALLITQVGLAVYLFSPVHEQQGGGAQTRLLAITDTAAIDSIHIDGEEGKTLRLRRAASGWTLPDIDDLPADDGRIDGLLHRLAGLERGWPVARTHDAAEHFRVTDGDFVRRIDLMHGDERIARLYLGTSPGFRKIHARVDGDDGIYAVALSAFEVAPKADDWLDKGLLSLNDERIDSITLPGVRLVRKDGALNLDGLGPDETLKRDAVDRLVDRIRHLTVGGLADSARPKADAGPFEMTIALADGRRLDYRFTPIEKDTDYRLEVTGHKHRFRIAATVVDELRTYTKDLLVDGHKDQDAKG